MPAIQPQDKSVLPYGRSRVAPWRANLRLAMLLMLSLAGGVVVAAALYDWWHDRPVRQVKSALARMQHVVVVDSMWATDYGGERPQEVVTELSLRLVGRSDATIQLAAVSPEAFTDAKHLHIYGLGGVGFKVERPAADSCIDVGADGAFAHLIPFPLRNVQDVVDHYDELCAIVATWPQHPEQARLQRGPGSGWTYARAKP